MKNETCALSVGWVTQAEQTDFPKVPWREENWLVCGLGEADLGVGKEVSFAPLILSSDSMESQEGGSVSQAQMPQEVLRTRCSGAASPKARSHSWFLHVAREHLTWVKQEVSLWCGLRKPEKLLVLPTREESGGRIKMSEG